MKIGIVGIGLIGGSFGRAAIKNAGAEVFGFDTSEEVLKKAKELNAISGILTPETAAQVDMLVIAVTPDNFENALDRFLPYLKRGATVTDFCGIKRIPTEVMRRRAKERPELNFIGGHPMAGREVSGVENSSSELFSGAPMILTNVNAEEAAFNKAADFFLSAGFKSIEITTPEDHDRKIAYTSQLCHVVSNAFIKNETAAKHDGYSAGSYKDLTRVARLDSEMWSALMTDNADYLEKELEEFIGNLSDYLTAIKNKDRAGLKALLKAGNDRKIELDEKGEKKYAPTYGKGF